MHEHDIDHHDHNQPVPRAPLIAMGILIAFVLTLIVIARNTTWFEDDTPPPAAVQTAVITLTGLMDGTVIIGNAADGSELLRYGPDESGFLQGMLRALKRERDRAEAEYDNPYRLTLFADGSLHLIDPSSGMEIDLRPFGPTNAQMFVDALHAATADP